MTTTPNFTDPQFVDANGPGGLNAAFSSVTASIGDIGSGAWAAPGLISPESMSITPSNLNLSVTVGLPMPFGIVSSGGAVVRAHGTTSNQDSQSYTVDFTSVKPLSGTVPAFLVATIAQIQQNPVAIPGPPQGHPSFNANFQPTVGFASNQDTIALTAVTGSVPDNVNSFELFRFTLSASAGVVPPTGASGISTMGWKRAPLRNARPVLVVGGGLLTNANAQALIQPSSGGLTSTLPPVSGAGGLVFAFSNPTAGNFTVAVTTGDSIGGAIASGGVSNVVIPPSGSISLAADPTGTVGGFWSIQGVSPNMLLAGNNTWTGTNAFNQPVTINDSSSAGALVINGTSDANGANIKLAGNGISTPNKFMRAVNGLWQIINSAYTQLLFQVDDAGNATATGNVSGAGLSTAGAVTAGSVSVGAGGITTTAGGGLVVAGGANITGTVGAGAFSTGGAITGGGITAGGSGITSEADGLIVGNLTVEGAAGINATGGPLNGHGNVTANGGFLRAGFGSRSNPGDGSCAVISSDFAVAFSAQNVWSMLLPNFEVQMITVNAPTNGGALTPSDWPTSFTNSIFGCMLCFGGDAPPSGVTISVVAIAANVVRVTTNAPVGTNPGHVGCTILAFGS